MKVLLVDNDPQRRDEIAALLRGLSGAPEVSTCATASEATALEALFRPGLLILPRNLPESAFEVVVRWNLGLPFAEQGLILALLESCDAEAVHEAMDAGASDFARLSPTRDEMRRRLDTAARPLAHRARLQPASPDPPLGRFLVNLTREIIVGVDTSRRIVLFNPAAERAFGCTEAEALGHHADMLYASPSDGGEFHEALMADGPITRDVLNVRRDGTPFTCRITASRFRDRAGRIAGIVGISHDMTEELRRETHLRDSEARLRRLAEGTRAMPWEIDLRERKATYAGPQTLAFAEFGSAEEISLDSFLKRIHPEDREGLVASFQQGVEQYANFELEFRVMNPAGAAVWVRTIISVERDAAGAPIIVRGFAFDNTSLRHAQDHAVRIQHAVENATDAILVVDSRSEAVFRNRAFLHMFGDQPAALGALVSGIADAQIASALSAAIQSMQPWSGEAEIHTPSGVAGVFLIRSNAIHDDAGTPLGSLCVLTEITERKRFDESRLQASKLESIGLLAGGIAHDFNNLLLIISGNLFLARSESEPASPALPFLAEAERGATRAADLAQQLLTFARGGAPVRKTARVDTIIRETVELNLHGSRTIAEFDIAPNLSPALLDRTQIAQAIANLVINAREAMGDRGTIRILARNETIARGHPSHLAPGEYVRVEVADEGPGIPQEILGRIFDPYFTTKSSGTGLGLATTHSIIRKHDGAILVDSQPGNGTRFTFYLPASHKPLKYESRRIDPIPRGTGRILLMDDEDSIRHVMRHALGRLGYEVSDAPNEEETLRLYHEARAAGHPFDLLILDLTIPGGRGGEEVIHDLLAEEPALKAIAASGYADNPVISQFQRFGFKGALKKPFQVEELARLVDRVLHNKVSSSF